MLQADPSRALVIAALEERRAALFGKMERFRDMGEAMCNLANRLIDAGKLQDAAKHLKQARKVAEAHGFFSVECWACQGLGALALAEGKHEEGIEMLRHALTAVNP